MSTVQEDLINLGRVRKLATLSYREIGRQLANGTKSVHPQVVKYHIDQLIKAQKLSESDRPAGASPQALTSSGKPQLVNLPMLGTVNAGPATHLANAVPEYYLRVSSNMLQSRNYQNLIALRVSGNSMNQAQVDGLAIENGDFVVVDRSKQTPRNNEIVIINNKDLINVKRIILNQEHGQVVLKSESSEVYDPIYLDAAEDADAFVEGTVVQVLKEPKGVEVGT